MINLELASEMMMDGLYPDVEDEKRTIKTEMKENSYTLYQRHDNFMQFIRMIGFLRNMEIISFDEAMVTGDSGSTCIVADTIVCMQYVYNPDMQTDIMCQAVETFTVFINNLGFDKMLEADIFLRKNFHCGLFTVFMHLNPSVRSSGYMTTVFKKIWEYVDENDSPEIK